MLCHWHLNAKQLSITKVLIKPRDKTKCTTFKLLAYLSNEESADAETKTHWSLVSTTSRSTTSQLSYINTTLELAVRYIVNTFNQDIHLGSITLMYFCIVLKRAGTICTRLSSLLRAFQRNSSTRRRETEIYREN